MAVICDIFFFVRVCSDNVIKAKDNLELAPDIDAPALANFELNLLQLFLQSLTSGLLYQVVDTGISCAAGREVTVVDGWLSGIRTYNDEGNNSPAGKADLP